MNSYPDRSPYTSRTVSVMAILDDAFRIVTRHFRLFLGIAALLVIPVTLVIAGTTAVVAPNYQAHITHVRDLTNQANLDNGSMDQAAITGAVEELAKDIGKLLAVGGVLSLTEYALMGSALVIATVESYAGRSTSILRCYQAAIPRVLPAIGTALAFGVIMAAIVAVPAVLAAIAGSATLAAVWVLIASLIVLFLCIRFSLYLPAVVIEKRATSALARSFTLTAGFFWKTVGLILLTTFTVALLILLSDTVVSAATHSNQIVSTIVNLTISTITMPLVLCAQTLLFLDLKTVREGYDTEQLVTDLNKLM
jgi:hypothetical protein